MKILKSILLSCSLSIMMACGSGETNSDANAETASENSEGSSEDYSGMREVDLSDYGISASIMTPPETKGKLEIEETSFGSLVIKVGDKFGVEIVPFGLTIAEAKEEMDQGGLYQIEILEEGENHLLYKKSIPDSEVQEEFHIFMNVEMNGEIYEIKSLAEIELKEAQARNILKAAKSFKAKEAV